MTANSLVLFTPLNTENIIRLSVELYVILYYVILCYFAWQGSDNNLCPKETRFCMFLTVNKLPIPIIRNVKKPNFRENIFIVQTPIQLSHICEIVNDNNFLSLLNRIDSRYG